MTAADERAPAEAAGERPGPEPGGAAGDDDSTAQAITIEEDSHGPTATGDASDVSPCGQCAGYLDALTRLKAEFANFRRRAADQQARPPNGGRPTWRPGCWRFSTPLKPAPSTTASWWDRCTARFSTRSPRAASR